MRTNNTDNSEITSPVILHSEKISITRKHRCDGCNKLLAIEQRTLPSFEIKCSRCGRINSFINEYSKQLIITDKNGVILYVSPDVEQITGYSNHELLGKTPAIWGNQMSREFYRKLWSTMKDRRKAVVVAVTNKHKNGHLYKVILRISPILGVNGDIEFFVGIESLVSEDK